MNSILNAIKAEPAVALALVQAVLTLAVSFGLHLSVEQTAGIVTVTQLALALITRQLVTPNTKANPGPQFQQGQQQ